MTSLAQNILENFQKVTETEAKPSRSDENLNTLFYNGKAIEKEIQTEQTGEFPSWISGRVSPTVLESSLTIIESSYPKIFNSHGTRRLYSPRYEMAVYKTFIMACLDAYTLNLT